MLIPSGGAIKRGVLRGRCVIEITVTWSLILPTPAEMGVSGSENFQNWRRIGFLFLQNQKIGRPVGFYFFPAKNRSVEAMSMSGFERLDRLSLPRRTRWRA